VVKIFALQCKFASFEEMLKLVPTVISGGIDLLKVEMSQVFSDLRVLHNINV